MSAIQEINAMVKSAGIVGEAVTSILTPIYEGQNRNWRIGHGLPEYPFTGERKYNSELGSAQAVADAYPRLNGTPYKPKSYFGGKRVTR